MSGTLRQGPPLAAGPTTVLHREWLDGTDGTPPATDDLARSFAADVPAAPFFSTPPARDWAREHRSCLPDTERARFDRDLARLRDGTAGVVVTGQQPGFLGGPLLTLHKIATAVALAERLEAAGRPTVPVFWSGDDDDDLHEALDPAAWLPGGRLVRSESLASARHGRLPRRRLGALPAALGHEAAEAWFAAAPSAADDLGLRAAFRGPADDTWAERQRRLVLRAFAGTGLLVVSGDDPRLHASGAGFYAAADASREALVAAVRERGRELEAAGAHAQLQERSLAHPLYRVDGPARRPLARAARVPPARLRPGVLLRAVLQDHLLAPRAVVVGPAELAYLRQLEPVRDLLGTGAPPLVPRLAAWLVPPDLDPRLLARHRSALADRTDPAAAVAAWCDGVQEDLASFLAGTAEVAPERAERLAAARRRRWERGLRAAVRQEHERARRAGPRAPSWVFPLGARQERRLAWVAALALGGRALRDGVLAAARAHLESGAEGAWHEWEWVQDEPRI